MDQAMQAMQVVRGTDRSDHDVVYAVITRGYDRVEDAREDVARVLRGGGLMRRTRADGAWVWVRLHQADDAGTQDWDRGSWWVDHTTYRGADPAEVGSIAAIAAASLPGVQD